MNVTVFNGSPAGKVSANPQAVALVKPWLETVERAGRELVAEGAVADDTAEALEAPLMDTADYVAFLGMG